MAKVDFKDLSVPLVNNVDADFVTENDVVKQSVIRQMSSHVQWWPSIQHFKDCDIIVEIGPGTKLSKMLKREWPDKEIVAVNTSSDIENLLTLLGKTVEKHVHDESCDAENCALEELVVVEDSKIVAEAAVSSEDCCCENQKEAENKAE